MFALKPKKNKRNNQIEETGTPAGGGEMASLELESSLVQSDRVLTPGPGVEYLDNSVAGSETWNSAYQDFFRRE